MKNVLVVNLTRFGDLLQTSPTIVGLKEEHPDATVTVMVDRNFAEVCRGLPGVDAPTPASARVASARARASADTP